MPSYAQSSDLKKSPASTQNDKVVVDAEFLKEAQKAFADRDRLKAENAAKDDLLASKDSQIASWKGLYEAEKVISGNWKESATARKSALVTDDRIMTLYEKRNATLEADLSKANKNKIVWGVVGFGVGIALGVYANRQAQIIR